MSSNQFIRSMPHVSLVFLLLNLPCGLLATENEPTKPEVERYHRSESFTPFLGFGIGIHPGDTIYPEAFDALGLEFVRLEYGPLWYAVHELIPSDASVAELYAYIDRNYNNDAPNRLEGAQYTSEFLAERGIRTILVHFEIPYHWRIDKETGQLRSEYVDDLARFYTAHLLYLKEHGVQIDYIELANEPDGHWNGHIPPTDYAQLVTETAELFKQHGLNEVKILGPGLAFLNLYGQTPKYMNALATGAFHHLNAWSAHTWDEVEFLSSQPEYAYGVWQPFLDGVQQSDPTGEKPIFLTEYGSDVLRYGETIYTSPRDAKADTVVDSWHYALRVMANSVSHLNRGVNALVLYRLSNAHWHKTGWGIIQPESKDSFIRKPVFHAVSEFLGDLPVGSQVLRPPQGSHDNAIVYTLLDNPDAHTLTLLAVNWTEQSQATTLSIDDVLLTTTGTSNIGLHSEGDFIPVLKMKSESSLSIELPAKSIARYQIAYRRL